MNCTWAETVSPGQWPPELGNLLELTELFLNDNRLSGEIPRELGNLTQLIRLDLWDNELTGPIPLELGNLTKNFLTPPRRREHERGYTSRMGQFQEFTCS